MGQLHFLFVFWYGLESRRVHDHHFLACSWILAILINQLVWIKVLGPIYVHIHQGVSILPVAAPNWNNVPLIESLYQQTHTLLELLNQWYFIPGCWKFKISKWQDIAQPCNFCAWGRHSVGAFCCRMYQLGISASSSLSLKIFWKRCFLTNFTVASLAFLVRGFFHSIWFYMFVYLLWRTAYTFRGECTSLSHVIYAVPGFCLSLELWLHSKNSSKFLFVFMLDLLIKWVAFLFL